MDLNLLPYLLAAALGALLAILAFPALMKYHANRKPRAAAAAVRAVDNLIATLNEEEEDDAQRKKNELDLQLRKLADRTAELHKAG